MRLPHLSKTQKKVAIGAGAGVGLLALTWLALRPSKSSKGSTQDSSQMLTAAKTSIAQAGANPTKSRILNQGQRVIAWPKDYDKNGMAYVKVVDGAAVIGGWVDEMTVLRDSEQTPSISMSPQPRALSGLGAGAIMPPQAQAQQQIAPVEASFPNAVMISGTLVFANPEDKSKLSALVKKYFERIELVGAGKALFVADEATFRKLYTHGGQKVLGLIPPIFYKDNKFTKDNLGNHSWCQTWAAQVVNLGNDWVWPYYNQSVYRYPSNVTPDPNLGRYPNSPIDPVKDNATWEAAREAAQEVDIQSALQNASFDGLLGAIEKITGSTAFTAIFGGGAPHGVYLLEATPELIDLLAKFGADYANDEDMTKKMSPEAKAKLLSTVNGDGKVSGEALRAIRAAIGAGLVSSVIDMFESHNTDPNKGVVNPCIVVENFDLYLGIFITVVSIFLTVVSLGSAGWFGPTIQAIKFVFYDAPKVFIDLAALSK